MYTRTFKPVYVLERYTCTYTCRLLSNIKSLPEKAEFHIIFTLHDLSQKFKSDCSDGTPAESTSNETHTYVLYMYQFVGILLLNKKSSDGNRQQRDDNIEL